MTKTVQQQPSSVDELRALLARATPGWCGAMVAAFALRRNSTLNFGDEGPENGDVELAKQIATAMPTILNELDIRLARIGVLEAAVTDLLTKFDAVKPAIDSAFAFQHIHGLRYSGPTLEVEIARARALLTPNAPEVSNLPPVQGEPK